MELLRLRGIDAQGERRANARGGSPSRLEGLRHRLPQRVAQVVRDARLIGSAAGCPPDSLPQWARGIEDDQGLAHASGRKRAGKRMPVRSIAIGQTKFHGLGKLQSSAAILPYSLLNELGRSPVMPRQQRHS